MNGSMKHFKIIYDHSSMLATKQIYTEISTYAYKQA